MENNRYRKREWETVDTEHSVRENRKENKEDERRKKEYVANLTSDDRNSKRSFYICLKLIVMTFVVAMVNGKFSILHLKCFGRK